MRRNVLVRVDGNSVTGLGHVVRCLALAEMIKTAFQVSFYSANSHQVVSEMCEATGIPFHPLKTEDSFLTLLTGNEIVVLDGYSFDYAYQKKIKEKKSALVCIDDLHTTQFCSDVVINHAPGVTEKSYRTDGHANFCLGPDFALLRPMFIKQANIPHHVNTISHVVINFGGADPANLTLRALKIVARVPQISSITVITGSVYSHNKELAATVEMMDRIVKCASNLSEAQMVQELSSADLAIIPSSGVLFEAIACRTPSISGFFVPNQRDIYLGFLERQMFYDAKEFAEEDVDSALKQALTTDPQIMIGRQEHCIDGQSPARILECFNILACK